jgi:aspartyl-tRNA(Asn)/glutamyl-tRNA(Gln) amidotransferase subunit A
MELKKIEALHQSCVEKITDHDLGAFLRICPPKEQSKGPLAGMSFGISDEICTRGVETTAGSRLLAGFIPPYQSTAVARLEDAGALILGKTNVDEFALGDTLSSAPQKTIHPLHKGYTPGGSAGGGAVAVASGQAQGAIASDVGGGVRIPSAICGIVGFIPTYGRISRFGVIEHAPSLNQVGIMAQKVEDIKKIYGVVAGHDPLDSTSLPNEVSPPVNLRGLRVGIINQVEQDKMEKAGQDLVNLTGCSLAQLDVEYPTYAEVVFHYIAAAEASSTLGTYDGVRFGHRVPGCEDIREMFSKTRAGGFTTYSKSMILLGTYILTGDRYEKYYLKALKARTGIIEEFKRLWRDCDVLITPTVPTTKVSYGDDVALRKYTAACNLAGLPAMTLPYGKKDGFPFGLQIIAPQGKEHLLLDLGAALERSGVNG